VIQRLRVSECQACGYSVEGLRTGTCPECGNDLHRTWREITGTRTDLPGRRAGDLMFKYGCMAVIALALVVMFWFLLPAVRPGPHHRP
jgi:hypothetical protein